MPLQLVVDEGGGIPIPLDDCVREAWMLQYDRATLAGAVDDFRERLAVCFAISLAECLDPDLKPPTDAQLNYAMVIARDMGISLPSEAIRFRGAMSDFLSRFADSYRQKRRGYLLPR